MNELSIFKYAIIPSIKQLFEIATKLLNIYHAPKYLP